jgi:site-specific DNA-adenine methylase
MGSKIIRYFGGKGGKQSTVIKSFIPKKYNTYVEPFGGSGTILFCQQSPIEIYNDIFDNVYSLFKVISDNQMFTVLKNRLDITPYSEKINKEFKKAIEERIKK